MINADGYCDHCKTWHRPDRKYWNDCPYPWVPLKRAPQPTPEEQAAEAIRAIELKVVHEHAARRRDAERRDWQQTRQRSEIGEMLNDVHRRQAASRDEALAKLYAQLEDSKACARRKRRGIASHERSRPANGRSSRSGPRADRWHNGSTARSRLANGGRVDTPGRCRWRSGCPWNCVRRSSGWHAWRRGHGERRSAAAYRAG